MPLLLELAHEPADILLSVLIAGGQVADPDVAPLGNWPGYVSSEPQSPDNCVTLYDTPGTDSGREMIQGQVLRHHGFQVRVRSADPKVGGQKANSMRFYLETSIKRVQVTLDGATYLVHAAARIRPVLAIGREKPTSSRSLFTINATAAITRVS